MRRLSRSGGWYGDCTIEGDDVTLYRDSHLEVNGVKLSLPPNQSNLIQLICIRWKGQLLIAGQGQSYSNWLYKDNEWHDLGPSFATFACAFSSDNLYLVVGPNQYRILNLDTMLMDDVITRVIGANGIHYIDFSQSADGIVRGDVTYGPQPYNLSQWLQNEDVVLGQSYIDGAVALYNARYLIEPGNTQFLRLHREGNNLAIAIVKMLENSTVYYWMTLADLVTFPLEGSKPTEPKVPGPIVNTPVSAPNPGPITPPTNKPSIPVSPVPKYKPLTPLKGSMSTERGGIIGPKGLFGRISKDDLGKGLFGWYPIHFDNQNSDGDSEFELTDLGNGRFTCRHVVTSSWYGADLTQYSDDITKEFYGKPNPLGAGPYEMPYGFGPLIDSGMNILMVQYPYNGGDAKGSFCSTPVTWVKK